MKCPRCEKEFPFEFLSVQSWLKSSKLGNQQLSFVLYNFGGPLCSSCEEYLRRNFYEPESNRDKTKKLNDVS